MPDGRWLSAYLVCDEPWTPLLRGGVRPFVETACASALCDRFFFIRYWEGGPHIRLRLRPARGVDPAVLRGQVDVAFGGRLSVIHAAYEPELERYGGPERIDIAERQFEASSRAVLAALEEDWPYEKALGAAVTMHVAFAVAARWSRREAAAFFGRAIAGLAHWLVGPQPSPEALRELLGAFADRFAPQREALRRHVDAVWEAALGQECDGMPWLADWTRESGTLLGELRDTLGGRLDAAFPILVSYIHMTNNRLGVANHDEAYLAFLLARSLEGHEPAA
jgi:thiopeptide-type bacteriocin biosynthesis protein